MKIPKTLFYWTAYPKRTRLEQLCHLDLQSLIFRHAIEEITESFANYSYNIMGHFLGLRSIFKDCFKHLWLSLRRTLNITGMSVASSSK